MINKYDIGQFVKTTTIQSVTEGLVKRVKERRKELKMTQKQLAIRSGVSYPSIRRFETTGEISLTSLLRIANAINALEDFEHIFTTEQVTNLKDY